VDDLTYAEISQYLTAMDQHVAEQNRIEQRR